MNTEQGPPFDIMKGCGSGLCITYYGVLGPGLLALRDVLLLLLSVGVGVDQPEVVQLSGRVLPVHLDCVLGLPEHTDLVHGGDHCRRRGCVTSCLDFPGGVT